MTTDAPFGELIATTTSSDVMTSPRRRSRALGSPRRGQGGLAAVGGAVGAGLQNLCEKLAGR